LDEEAMKSLVRINTLFVVALALSACAWFGPLEIGQDARRNAKVALTAYEATQQAMLIYGRLPGCDMETGVVRFCRDSGVWRKIKAADRLATAAITSAAPVLQGEAPDAGEVVAALSAIAQVQAALREAQDKLTGPST
jgi:hypothetical protein